MPIVHVNPGTGDSCTCEASLLGDGPDDHGQSERFANVWPGIIGRRVTDCLTGLAGVAGRRDADGSTPPLAIDWLGPTD